MNSAYNQSPLEKQSRRLTQFLIGNQQHEINRLYFKGLETVENPTNTDKQQTTQNLDQLQFSK